MLTFHLYYKTALGHGRRGSDIQADSIESAFGIARNRDSEIWEKAKTKEFYVTPAKIKSGKDWIRPKKYPRYTTYGVQDGKGISLYISSMDL